MAIAVTETTRLLSESAERVLSGLGIQRLVFFGAKNVREKLRDEPTKSKVGIGDS